MKNLTLTMTSLFLSVLMIFTSCTKQNEIISPTTQQDVITQEFLIEMENMSQEYTSAQGQRIWPLILGLVCVDALSAGIMYMGNDQLSAEEYGMAGLVGSAIAAVKVAGTNSNPMPWYKSICKGQYVEKTISNPNNFMEMTGVYHNRFLINGTINSVDKKLSIYQGALASTSSKMNIPSEKKLLSMLSGVTKCKNEFDIQNLINNSTFPKGYKVIMSNYFSVVYSAKSIAAFQQYSENVENMVAANKGLSKNTKENLLLTMSVAKHSAGIWNSIL